jgi:hypothetical protein
VLPFLVVSTKFIILICCAERVLQFIVARLKLTYTNTMATSQRKIKNARSGRVVRFEPQDLKLINADPTIRASFEQVICMHLCERIQGYNAQLVEQFTLNFTGVSATIAGITFQVTKETMSVATKIPL